MKLKDFQEEVIIRLNTAMAEHGRRDIILKAPTGSGKTIILTRFMQEYMHDNADVAFVWLTPGKGELEEQSKSKMDHYCHNASTKNLADVMAEGFAAGDAIFINWEKLTKKGSNALKDSERTNFLEWVKKAQGEGVAFKIIIDESHQNFTEKADSIVSLFGTDKIIRASATPKEDKTAIYIEVPEADVIAAGLVKKSILINPDFPHKVALSQSDIDGTAYLLEQAYTKREELLRAFMNKGRSINPLILVQMPNNSDAQLDEIEKWFGRQHIDVEGGSLAVWLSGRHDNLEGLADNDGRQIAVIIKQAVATGWDCPRAHILVKLRHNMDETFEVQTIGRIRRMPEAIHYDNDLLDSCYLYTLDGKFTEGVRRELGNYAQDAKKLFIKPEHKPFSLIKEQRTMVTDQRDPVVALNAVLEYLKQRYKITAEDNQIQTRLKTAGYDFRADIWRYTQSGEVTETKDLVKGKGLVNVAFSQRLNTHKHGRAFHHVVANIGSGCGLPYEDCRKVIFRLFSDVGKSEANVLSFDSKTLYAFVINNERQLKEDFRAAMSSEGLHKDTINKVAERPFFIPHEWVMTYNGESRVQQVCEKNVYGGYLQSARPRSNGEIKFERWCEGCSSVEWWYRNGDMGETFFSIVYDDNARHQRLFYPDYILSISGEIWIIEVKGGFSSSGQSENIDSYAAKKAGALKRYCAKYGLHGGIVRYDEGEDALLISEDGFSENPKDWKLLDSVI